MCTSLGKFPRDGNYNRWRGSYIREVQPQDAWSLEFFQDRLLYCPKHVGATAVAHVQVATIFVAAHLTRTFAERMYGHLLQLPHQDSFELGTVSAGGSSAGPARTLTKEAAPTTPPGGVIEQHATIEHSWVSQDAPRAGPATIARMCGPAGPSRGQGSTWADHESSWAVLQMTFQRTKMCSTNSLRLRRRHHWLLGIHSSCHSDPTGQRPFGGAGLCGPLAGWA